MTTNLDHFPAENPNQDQHTVYRYNRILEGINRIFSIILQAKTEEELGNECLSVALEITGSQYGFVGEVGLDGRLHDIAISDMGWQKCAMYNKSGHRRPPGDFILHGLYGSVIDNAKGFFTNDPLSHPDSIGLPPGHPSLTSFLGVPLIEDGKAVGMIAVANREGGYSCEQMEDLEAIAPAVVQALKRKKAEDALQLAYEKLQVQSEELQVQNEELQAQSEELQVQNEELQAQSEELQVANEALAESEERFRTMANAIPQLAWIARANGYIYWYNERWYAYTGTTPEQMEGWGWESVHDPAVLPKVLKQWKVSIATGRPFDMEFPLRGSDGIFRQFLTRAIPLKDANGQVFQWFGTNTDITERKLAEEALRKQAALIDLSPDAIITRQLDGTITFWSKGAQLLYGWTSQEAIGQKTHTMLNTRFPQPLEQIIKQLQQTGLWTGELIHYTKDGRQVIVQSRWMAEFDDKGHLRELLESNVDITDRKQVEESLKLSEQKFFMAFANNPAAIALTRLEDGLFLEVNDTWVALTGYSRDEAIGNFARKMNIWPTAEAAANFVQELRKKGFISGWEQEFYRKSGDVFTAQLSAQILTVREETMILSTLVDITERKQAEEELTATYSQIQSIIDNTPDLIYAFDLEERFLLANAAVANVLNSTPDRMIGKRRDEFMPKKDADWHEANDRQVFEAGRVLEFEEYSHLEGRSITWLTKKFPLRDAQGRIYAVAGISADITERKQMEEQIRQRAEELETVMDVAPVSIWIGHDPQSHYITGNRTANKFYEAVIGENVSANVTPLRRFFYKGCELDADELPMQQASLKDIDIRNSEFDVLLPSGEWRALLGSASPLHDANGHVRGSVGAFIDITERKKAEVKLTHTLDNLDILVKERTAELEKAYTSLKESKEHLAEAQKIAHIGNWSRDIVTGEVHWSDEVYRIFGFKLQEFGISYDSFLSQVVPEDREFVINRGKQALNGKFFEIEYRIIRADGVERVVHENVKVIFDEKNNPIHLIGTIQEITERKNAEEALARIDIARKKEIHHRIKNNLQVISSLLDLQAEQFKNKECIKDSEVLEAFRDSQDRVISMALIHEELYKGGGFETLNFSPYIKRLSENIYQTYSVGNKNISLKLDLPENALFDMDLAVPLGMIVNELVTNSYKHAFIGRESGKINIKLNREENEEYITNVNEDRTTFVLTVSDNGIGIPEDIKIEELDSLGMQLVTTLVDQLDGELELKRENGTEFIIRFTETEKSNQASEETQQQLVDNE